MKRPLRARAPQAEGLAAHLVGAFSVGTFAKGSKALLGRAKPQEPGAWD